MGNASTTGSGNETTLELIPDGTELIAAVSLSRGTSFQVSGWTKELVELANSILAAESNWMPPELVSFAQDVLALRRSKMLPLELNPNSLDGQPEPRSEADLQVILKTRDAIKGFSTLVRGILYEVAKRLEREAREWDESKRPERVQ